MSVVAETTDITIVIPVFNESNQLAENFAVIRGVCDSCNKTFSFLFVDDGSTDDTRSVLSHIRRSDPCVEYISFTRNFGKEAAIEAGLTHARGRACIVMDADLQHPAELIPKMIQAWDEGYYIADAVKRDRGDKGIRRMLANSFYAILRRISSVDLENRSDFKLLDKKVIEFYLQLRERHKFFRGVIAWSGFSTKGIEFDVGERQGGESKWSFTGLVKYAFVNIASFSYVPMMVMGWLGFLIVIITGCVGVVSFVRWTLGDALPGFTTVILLLSFVGGALLLGLGIVAYYISLLMDEARGRPRFVVDVQERNV